MDPCSLGFFQSFQDVPSEMLARARVCSDGKTLFPPIPFSQDTAQAIPGHSKQRMTARSRCVQQQKLEQFPLEKQDEDVELMIRSPALARIPVGASRKTRNDPTPLCSENPRAPYHGNRAGTTTWDFSSSSGYIPGCSHRGFGLPNLAPPEEDRMKWEVQSLKSTELGRKNK